MIVQAIIYRLDDGLPLSASTDVVQYDTLKQCQKYIKILSRRFPHLPDKCSLQLNEFFIHFISTRSLAFLVVTEASCPAVLAFSFLVEIQKQFLVNYDTSIVLKARRPYEFIVFDNALQKCKHRYNNPRSLVTKVDLGDMSTELKLRPPYTIREEDLGIGLMVRNGVTGSSTKSNANNFKILAPKQLEDLTWICWLVIVMNTFTIALNFIRGMAFIGHGHLDDDDAGAYSYGFTFLFAAVVHCYQISMLVIYSNHRNLQIFTTCVLLCLCITYLQHFRNWLQIAFHLIVTVYTTLVLYNRQIKEKMPGYSV